MIDYNIIKRVEAGKFKLAFDVLVYEIPSKDDLEFILNYLVCREERNHDKTFVCFYLPGMEVGSGAFATAHHNPKLEVKIMDYIIPEKYKVKDIKPIAWCVNCRKEIKPRTIINEQTSITIIECDVCYPGKGV